MGIKRSMHGFTGSFEHPLEYEFLSSDAQRQNDHREGQ
jgi:hypothetical protein